MLTAPRLKKSGNRENNRGQRAPNGRLRRSIGEVMAFEKLGGADDDERSDKDNKKALDPEPHVQNILPLTLQFERQEIETP